MREWLRSLPWDRIVWIAIAVGFLLIEYGTSWHMGRRSIWVFLAITSLLFGLREASDWLPGRSMLPWSGGSAASRMRRDAADRRAGYPSKGAVGKAREQRLGRWRAKRG